MAEVVIAVRGGPAAKSRCRPALGPACAALSTAMLADMLDALAAAPSVARVHVVTPTPELAELAERMGAAVILETEPDGLNAAFDRGRRGIAPGTTVALLPGDLPLLDPRDLERALAAWSDDAVVLVPATADGGTGAVILRADTPLPLAFGADSFRRHLAAVQALGLLPRVVSAASLGFDLDRPADIAAVLARPPGGRTREVLATLPTGAAA